MAQKAGSKGDSAKAPRKVPETAKLPVASGTIQDLWDRIDTLYADCASGAFTVNEASALSRIVGRQITLLSIASSLQRRTQIKANLKLLRA